MVISENAQTEGGIRTYSILSHIAGLSLGRNVLPCIVCEVITSATDETKVTTLRTQYKHGFTPTFYFMLFVFLITFVGDNLFLPSSF